MAFKIDGEDAKHCETIMVVNAAVGFLDMHIMH